MGASPYDIRVTILMRPMIMAINLGLCYPGFPVAALRPDEIVVGEPTFFGVAISSTRTSAGGGRVRQRRRAHFPLPTCRPNAHGVDDLSIEIIRLALQYLLHLGQHCFAPCIILCAGNRSAAPSLPCERVHSRCPPGDVSDGVLITD